MMQSKHDKSLFSFRDREDFHRLRGVFEAVNFTEAGILEALGIKDFFSFREDNTPLLLHRTNRGTPLDTLIRLFLIEVPTDIEVVRRAIRPISLEMWAEAGRVEINGPTVVAALKLLSCNDLILAFDPPASEPPNGSKTRLCHGHWQ